LIRSRAWDWIYIDGNHDYDVVRPDWQVCAEHVRPGGLIVLDDAAISSAYQPPPVATRGHPGPSRVTDEIDRGRFEEILQVGHNRVFQKGRAILAP
jgi:predicted O-methyltransferase YrrM